LTYQKNDAILVGVGITYFYIRPIKKHSSVEESYRPRGKGIIYGARSHPRSLNPKQGRGCCMSRRYSFLRPNSSRNCDRIEGKSTEMISPPVSPPGASIDD
jgi:hypothetical protein